MALAILAAFFFVAGIVVGFGVCWQSVVIPARDEYAEIVAWNIRLVATIRKREGSGEAR